MRVVTPTHPRARPAARGARRGRRATQAGPYAGVDGRRHAGMGGRHPGSRRRRPAGAGRAGRPRARSRTGPRAGAGLRRLPHRSPPGRGRPRAAPRPGHPGARDRGRGRPGRPTGPAAGGPATASACPGSPTPAGCADSARRGARTSASTRSSRAGTSTGATPSTPSWTRPTRTALPAAFDDEAAAPLLCAGIIGYRALERANLPAGGRLGIYGFGGSAHLTAQIALARGARVHVMTRSPAARELALELGAASAAEADAAPPEPLDAAILFAPVGTLVPPALAALDRGGTLAVAGIYLSEIPPLDYEAHLFEERTLQSVTANTRRDGEEFLAEAARIGLRVVRDALSVRSSRRGVARPGPRRGQRGCRPGCLRAFGRPRRPSAPRSHTASTTKGPTVPQSIDVKNAVTGPLAIGPGALDWGTHAGSAIRR